MNRTSSSRRVFFRTAAGTIAAIACFTASCAPLAKENDVSRPSPTRVVVPPAKEEKASPIPLPPLPMVDTAPRRPPRFLTSDPDVLDDLAFGSVLDVLPPLRARIRLIGDMHFGFTTEPRWRALQTDLERLPRPDAILTTGDETHMGQPEQYRQAAKWAAQWRVPFHTVTGNHTFWNATVCHKETSKVSYARWVHQWGRQMPYTWSLAGVRFVCVGPTTSGTTSADASLVPDQVEELRSVLAQEPNVPTVIVMHSPLYRTVLGDNPILHTCYTSEDPGFFQRWSEDIQSALASAPQVILMITGHTHSPLHAQGLMSLVPAGETLVPHFNAMAVPFLRRLTAVGPLGPQALVTWELGVSDHSLVLVGRDHLQQRDQAVSEIPLGPRVALPPTTWLSLASDRTS